MNKKEQMKLANREHRNEPTYDILDLPAQLQTENIDNFIRFMPFDSDTATYGSALVIEDEACRKRMNQYRSVAERLATRILTSVPGRATTKRVAKYRGTKKETIDALLASDEFADVRDVIRDEILPIWDIERFVLFFATQVRFVVDNRQLQGMHRQYCKLWTENLKPWRNDEKDDQSAKQQFRSAKKITPRE